ncbi:MAG: two-component regulator propeller domain-containing protein, partial [Bacteroidota bacterium]
MKLLNYFLATFLLVGIGLHGQPGEFYVSHFGVAEGVSNEWISDITQDSTGFLWLATQYGLNRFDGQTFTPYTYRPGEQAGPSANWIKRILAVNNNTLLLSTLGKGIGIMSSQTEAFTTAEGSWAWPNLGVVDDIHQDEQGNYWLATSTGTYLYQNSQDSLIKLFQSRSKDIAEWPGTGVFVVDAEGIRLASSGQVISADLIYSQPTNAVFPLAEDSLLCVTPRTLKLLVKEGGGDWLATDWELSLPAEDHYFYLPRFLRTPQGEIWLTSGSVIWSISPNLEESIAYSPREILGEVCGDCKVYSLFYDREGNHWWGTNRGLFQLTPAINFRDIGLAKLGEQLPNVREILRVGTDLWLATNRGLFVWSGHSNEKPQLVDIVSYHSLHHANDGYVYTVEENVDRGVLHRFNPIAKKRDWGGRQPPVLPKGQHWKITEDQRGRLWISRWNQLSCYDPASHQAFSIHLQRENKNLPLGIIDLFIDQEDNLWVGNLYAGLIKIPAISENQRGKRLHFDQFLTDPTTSNSISTNLIQQIYQSQDGTIWVGTDAGLNSYQPEDASFRRFLRNEQMIDDKILSITSDQTGKLWMGTVSHGIMSFDPVEERFDNYTQ